MVAHRPRDAAAGARRRHRPRLLRAARSRPACRRDRDGRGDAGVRRAVVSRRRRDQAASALRVQGDVRRLVLRRHHDGGAFGRAAACDLSAAARHAEGALRRHHQPVLHGRQPLEGRPVARARHTVTQPVDADGALRAGGAGRRLARMGRCTNVSTSARCTAPATPFWSSPPPSCCGTDWPDISAPEPRECWLLVRRTACFGRRSRQRQAAQCPGASRPRRPAQGAGAPRTRSGCAVSGSASRSSARRTRRTA